jgi:hypothetical protein
MISLRKKPLTLEKLLEKREFGNSRTNYPIILVDTSGIIDIQHMTNDNRHNKEYDNKPLFCDAYDYLKEFSGKIPILATQEVCNEVRLHSLGKINGHVYEISPMVADLVCSDFCKNFSDLSNNSKSTLDPEDVRYIIYWVAKEACRENHKKHEEGFSETDKKILYHASILSKSTIETPTGPKMVSPVGILTSDEHIICGIKYLKKEGNFDGLYIIPTKN